LTTELLLIVLAISVVGNLVIFLFFRSKPSKGDSAVREELRTGRSESAQAARDLREEVAATLNKTTESVTKTIDQLGSRQKEQLVEVTSQVKQLTDESRSRIEGLRSTISEQLTEIRNENEKKLEEMRKTVDEKLQGTLERRFNESFKVVGDQLEAVYKGLGEMKNLATGVGDLKNVLTNVKVRGTWAEYQLEAILQQILTPDQYERNVATKSDSSDHVEFAIRLPGPSNSPESPVWLPIDAKFPQEDYIRLMEASRSGDVEGIEQSTKELIRSVTASAKTITEKYVDPPHTTDFAVMYLPTEGLYAEVVRQPGLIEEFQTKYRVTVAGPTTMGALLNSLRLGFRTLVIEQRASEVWRVLAAVKSEFEKFGEALEKVKKRLNSASDAIEQTDVRTRAMERKLRGVEQLPSGQADELLSPPASGPKNS
jgi:DNA recombination protein RmuC|tara:strand:- start:1022 stop:2302 length:1281 start_codon:yes stop_codon:yes gene_type:complete